MQKQPLLLNTLEPYQTTPEGLSLWKLKDVDITCENLLESIFILSSDIATYFGIRHDNLCRQNISKLQKRKYLPDQLLKFKELITVGKSAKKPRIIYGLTRQQTEHLIMDFSGPRAFQKKHEILNRLHAIESHVLKGAYEEARKVSQNFDGIEVLKELGFNCALDNRLATKKEIASFLSISESALNGFLRKHQKQIQPIKLSTKSIREMGRKANKLNAYSIEDVLKIAFWANSEIGVKLKKKLLGKSAVLIQSENRKEIEWRVVLSKIFKGFDLRYNHPIDKYKVDFFIPELLLVLECDENHESYNLEEEEKREKIISCNYTLIRFNPSTKLEVLVNAILRVQIKEVIRLNA